MATVKSKPITIILAAAVGTIMGVFLLHPFTMGVYRHFNVCDSGASASPQDVFRGALSAYHGHMFAMGLPFAALGALAGLLFALWLIGKRRADDVERQLVAKHAINELMVSLSHYQMNSLAVILGIAEQVIEKHENEPIGLKMKTVRRAALRMEAVTRCLLSLKQVKSEHYLREGDTMMIDIKRELEDELRRVA